MAKRPIPLREYIPLARKAIEEDGGTTHREGWPHVSIEPCEDYFRIGGYPPETPTSRLDYSTSASAMTRSLTPSEKRQRRFSFFLVDPPASDQRNLLCDGHLTGISSAFILASGSRTGDVDPIFNSESGFQGPIARSTPPLISSARPSPHSTPPPMLPKSSAAPHMRHGPWAE